MENWAEAPSVCDYTPDTYVFVDLGNYFSLNKERKYLKTHQLYIIIWLFDWQVTLVQNLDWKKWGYTYVADNCHNLGTTNYRLM